MLTMCQIMFATDFILYIYIMSLNHHSGPIITYNTYYYSFWERRKPSLREVINYPGYLAQKMTELGSEHKAISLQNLWQIDT